MKIRHIYSLYLLDICRLYVYIQVFNKWKNIKYSIMLIFKVSSYHNHLCMLKIPLYSLADLRSKCKLINKLSNTTHRFGKGTDTHNQVFFHILQSNEEQSHHHR